MSGMSGTIAPLRLALAQINTARRRHRGQRREDRRRGSREARDAGAELVLFPELAVTGYPPEDLLLKEHFLLAAGEAVPELAREAEGIVALVGFPERADDVHNAFAVLAEGERQGRLPQDGAAELRRVRRAALLPGRRRRRGARARRRTPRPDDLRGHLDARAAGVRRGAGGRGADPQRLGVARTTPARASSASGCSIQRARDNLAAVAFSNLVGGQDELIFDGHSLLIDHEGTVLARAPQFEESLTVATVDLQAAMTARLRDTRLRKPVRAALPEVRRAAAASTRREDAGHETLGGDGRRRCSSRRPRSTRALVLGTRDYVEKNGFQHVVIGLSGGIDSTLTR